MAFPPVVRGGGQYTTEPDPDDQGLSAQIDPRSLMDPTAQMPTKVPMTFVIVNGQRIAIPEGEDEGGDDLDTMPPKPALQPPQAAPRPPVITNPLNVLGSTGSATGKALGTLSDQPGDLGAAARAFKQEIPRAVYAPSVGDLTSPSQELRKRGVEPGTIPSLLMDLSLDPQNIFGGEPITGMGKVGVLGAMALPEGARWLSGLPSRLATHVLPLLPEKGWAADRILSKIASGVASKEELAATGLQDWLKSLGGKIVTKADFEQEVKARSLPIYERWYGDIQHEPIGEGPTREALLNAKQYAKNEMDYASRFMGDALTEKVNTYALAQGRPLTEAEIRGIVKQHLGPNAGDEAVHAHIDNAQHYFTHRQKWREADQALRGIPEIEQLHPPKWGASYSLSGGTNWRELTIGLAPETTPPGNVIPPFTEGSWKYQPYKITSVHRYDDPNMLLHVRAGDYLTDDGRKVLLINEGQSDAHAAARDAHEALIDQVLREHQKHAETSSLGLSKKEQLARDLLAKSDQTPSGLKRSADTLAALDKQGYGTVPSGFGGHQLVQADVVPDIPFKGSGWQTLLMKRMLAYAAEHGYDEIAWTTGLQQSERYNKALRDVTSIKMTPDGMIQVFKRGADYPAHTFGPYAHPSEAAHAIGADTARRLAAIPQQDNIWKYSVEDNSGHLTWKSFESKEAAEAQRALDAEVYHLADEPPEPASWWGLHEDDRERIEAKWKNSLSDLDQRRTQAQMRVDRRAQNTAERKSAQAVDRAVRRVLGRLTLPDPYHDVPDLDWQTLRVSASESDALRQPTFGERPGATKVEQRGYAARGDTPAKYTVRDAIVDHARRSGIDLDPDSITLTTKGHEDVIRNRTHIYGYAGGTYGGPRPTKRPYSGGLRTMTGQPLAIHEQQLVQDAAEKAFEDVDYFNDQVKDAVRAKYRAKAPQYTKKYVDDFKASPDYENQIQNTLNRDLDSDWYSLTEPQKLAIGQELNIKEAFDPPEKELRPYTGETGEIQPPDMSRELDLSKEPLTISSKGMEQQYDKSMVDIANGFGKKYGQTVRPIEIKTGKPILKGSPRVVPDRDPTGRIEGYNVVAGEGDNAQIIHRFRDYSGDASTLPDMEQNAHRMVKQLKEDRTVWAMHITPEMAEGIKKNPFPLMAALPPAIGTYLTLKHGQRVRVTKTYEDGSFDADPAPEPRKVQP
jgi:hypothetical protein